MTAILPRRRKVVMETQRITSCGDLPRPAVAQEAAADG